MKNSSRSATPVASAASAAFATVTAPAAALAAAVGGSEDVTALLCVYLPPAAAETLSGLLLWAACGVTVKCFAAAVALYC